MQKLIAKNLLDINAVLLRPQEPFTLTSGIKSPIYCDNRLTLSYPDVRENIENGLCELIKKDYFNCEMVMGTATAGIPHASIVSYKLGLPMGYVRASSKKHGKANQVEGIFKPNLKVVVVEDLISTAKSSLETVFVLKNMGYDVLGIVSIFTYDLEIGLNNLKNAMCKNISLSNYNALIEVAKQENIINERDILKLNAWQKNPSSFDWINL